MVSIGGAICTQSLQQVEKQYKVSEGDIIKVEKLDAGSRSYCNI